MKRKFYIFTLLVTSYFFNSGFLFKPNIRAIICNSNAETYSDLEKNLKTQEPFIDNWPFVFDINTGQQYKYDKFKNTFFKMNEFVDNGIETKILKSDIKDQKLYVVEAYLIDNYYMPNTKAKIWKEDRYVLDFKNLTLISFNEWFDFDGPITIDGDLVQKSVCANLELPKNYQIEK